MNSYLMDQCWNKVGMAKRSFSLTNLPGSKCPKFGSKREKKIAKNRLLIAFGPHKSAQSVYFGLKGVEKVGLQHRASRKIS